jgi:hypothetical protein
MTLSMPVHAKNEWNNHSVRHALAESDNFGNGLEGCYHAPQERISAEDFMSTGNYYENPEELTERRRSMETVDHHLEWLICKDRYHYQPG